MEQHPPDGPAGRGADAWGPPPAPHVDPEIEQAIEHAIEHAVEQAVDEAVEEAIDEAVDEAIDHAVEVAVGAAMGAAAKRDRRRFGIEIVLVALIVGAAAGATTGVVASRQDRVRAGASTTAATTVVASTSTTSIATTAPSSTAAPSTTATIPPETLQAVIRRVVLSVVDLQVSGTLRDEYGRIRTGDWAGSGFVIDASGIIATNAHVVEGAETITVITHDGRSIPATLLGSDAEHDLAVVKVEDSDLPPLDLAVDRALEVGDSVIAVGNALNLEGSPTVSVGIISALARNVEFADGSTLRNLIQTDASISSGDSGGPLLTETGLVVGVNTAGMGDGESTTAENIGFAIPISEAAPILFRLAGR